MWSLVIAIGTAARQIPAERENRTIFPLLAKPVSRWQVILGKFFGETLDRVDRGVYEGLAATGATRLQILMLAGWPSVLREVIGLSLLSSAAVGAPCTWVLSNHDVWRPVTRLAPWLDATTIDLEAGKRRALALSLVSLALPGSAYLYQGEELGLPEVLDLPDDARQDPT